MELDLLKNKNFKKKIYAWNCIFQINFSFGLVFFRSVYVNLGLILFKYFPFAYTSIQKSDYCLCFLMGTSACCDEFIKRWRPCLLG